MGLSREVMARADPVVHRSPFPVSPSSSIYLFATCNPGWESSLKSEVRRLYGAALTPAFLRPGLVTWKVVGALVEEKRRVMPVFAHVFGTSLGMAKSPEELSALAATVGSGPLRLHVFPRVLPENGFTHEEWAAIDGRVSEIRQSLEQAGVALHESDLAKPNEIVLDVILGEPDEALFLGTHRHDGSHAPFPGAMPRGVLPPDAPSRAWLKMEQALAFAGFGDPASLRGRHVIELGSAPGGGSFSLLQHGANVIGVDTGEMDERVLAFSDGEGASFTHVATSAGEIAVVALPNRIEVLTSDMNLAPPVALRYIERIQRRVRARTLILTLKINDAKMEAAIPSFLDRVRKFAPGEVRATQLPSNRKEITIFSTRPR